MKAHSRPRSSLCHYDRFTDTATAATSRRTEKGTEAGRRIGKKKKKTWKSGSLKPRERWKISEIFQLHALRKVWLVRRARFKIWVRNMNPYAQS